jgi:hypothetical protein
MDTAILAMHFMVGREHDMLPSDNMLTLSITMSTPRGTGSAADRKSRKNCRRRCEYEDK